MQKKIQSPPNGRGLGEKKRAWAQLLEVFSAYIFKEYFLFVVKL